MRPVADSVQAALCMPVFIRAAAEGVEVMHPGQDDEEQEGKPDAVRSQRLRENGEEHLHKMNLLYGALRPLYPVVSIAHGVVFRQDDAGPDRERIRSGIRSSDWCYWHGVMPMAKIAAGAARSRKSLTPG